MDIRADPYSASHSTISQTKILPVEIACLAEAIWPGYQATVFVGAYGGLRIGELAGLRRSRVPQDTGTAGTIDVAETAVMSRTGCCSGHPRPGPAGGRSGFLAAWSTNWRCRCTGMAGEVYDMVADVVEAIEEIFEGSSGLVGDVDEVAMRGSSDGLLDVTDLDLCPEIPLAVK